MTPRSTLSAVIVSYQVRDLLRACLAATYASLARSPELDATVWVVDNASADGSAEMVASEFPRATLVARQDNLGFAGGNNLVLAALGFGGGDKGDRGGHAGPPQQPGPAADSGGGDALRGDGPDRGGATPPQRSGAGCAVGIGGGDAPRPDLVLLLNPDAEPLDDAIGQMAGFLAGHPRAGGVGARLQYPDGTFQHGAFAVPGLLQLWFDLFPPRPRRLLDTRLNGRYPRHLYDAGEPFPIDFALGASLMVRRAAIEAAGLLDEGYFMYAEEVDWCWRIQRAGWPFFCVPASRVVHHGGASTRQYRSESALNLWRSRRRLYARFYGPVRQRLAGGIVRLGMAAERRRAQAANRRGEMPAAELAERTQTAAAISRMFS
jgi:N-acetylglucosaminyl-diphospho-decaprenol L-rhamnosyltransferase